MEEQTSKPKSKKVLIFLFFIINIIIAIAVWTYFYFQGYNPFTNTVTVPFPYTMNVADNTSFACESLVSADIIGSPEEYLTNGIEGEVQKGTDIAAMEILDSKTLSFQTGASLKVGEAEGDNFAILHNDSQKLLAVWFSKDSIHSIVLNKKMVLQYG